MKSIMVDWCILITIDYIFQISSMSCGGNMMAGLQDPEKTCLQFPPPGNKNTLYFIMKGQVKVANNGKV